MCMTEVGLTSGNTVSGSEISSYAWFMSGYLLVIQSGCALLDHVCWHKKIDKETTHCLNSYALCWFSTTFKNSLRLDHWLTHCLHITNHFYIWNYCLQTHLLDKYVGMLKSDLNYHPKPKLIRLRLIFAHFF